MGKRVHYLREVSEREASELRQLSNSRSQPYRSVQRAKLIVNTKLTPFVARGPCASQC